MCAARQHSTGQVPVPKPQQGQCAQLCALICVLPSACPQATAEQCPQLCVVICVLPGCSVYARGFMEQFRIMLWKFNIVYWRLPEYNGVR